MRRIRLVLAIGLLLVATLPVRAAVLPPNPVPVCPAGQSYFESQSWWSDARVPFPGQHIHLATCFPHLQTVSGVLTFNVHGMLHGDPGRVTLLRVQITAGNIQKHVDQKIDWRCTSDCARDFQISIDTNSVPAGRKEIRLTFNIPDSPIGNRQFSTTRWHLCVRSCTGSPAPNANRTGAAGWYEGGTEYSNVKMNDADATRLIAGPISGNHTIRVAGDANLVVAVDAKSHGADPGLVLYDGAGGSSFRSVTIPTTQLANGVHRLFIRTDKSDTAPKGINSGVFVIPFTVDN